MITQEKIIEYLYKRPTGRMLLKVLLLPQVSNTAGKILDAPISKVLIPGFIRRNHIDMSQFEEKQYLSYNDFFTRRVKNESRPVDMEADHFISPCDAKLSVYPIEKDSRFLIKGTEYTMKQLCHSKKISDYYEGGMFLLFRLTVDDYHRYCYVDDGRKSDNYRIPGVYHTVNPIANECYPIYKENTREFSLLKSKHFGTIFMMEVGAMLVGRIVNNHRKTTIRRGQEKGRFEFGGSTIILCVRKDEVHILPKIMENTKNGIETVVKLGEVIGYK